MTKRKLFSLEIYGNLTTGNERLEFEAGNWAQAIKIKNMLLKGRPYFHLQEICTVER
jgi:hypothetical protein